jgi:hypothetical protein
LAGSEVITYGRIEVITEEVHLPLLKVAWLLEALFK